jgi:hypothetical protein
MMKAIFVFTAGVLMAATSVVWGAPIIDDNFDYTPGTSLEGNGSWTLRGPGTGIVVEAGNVPSPAGGVPATGNSILMHDGQVDGGTAVSANMVDIGAWDSNLSPALYYSMNLRITSTAGLANTLNGVFIAGFNNQDATPTGTAPTLFHARLQVRAEPGGYQLGVSGANATSTFPASYDPTIRAVDEVVFLVIKLQMHPGTVELDEAFMWINPDASTFGDAVEPAPLLSNTAGVDQFNTVQSFGLRTVSTGPEFTQIDELRIGTTWADVVPVPEPSMSVLASIVGLALLLRRRRELAMA